ncbi:aspartate carbamoyltransferase regulatory subunit [Peptoniphilus equinus]|uniref:Aspartate carbamoyltransferase regulatory subunit n=1 Tax=Peptoniphilus equinus TaxID=3016343 RepID=A0ABY7QSM5_9FIRM|nr:aspartate carbamoyltransferase regulatory subunit [Peptoniphilus equinus]WBW49790.1 aspartate carbamoyltransferase regulatory subunit [Peptoniphilus equinus]
MINVSKIKKGLVLDHIEHGKGKMLYQALHLDEVEDPVVLMQGISSTTMGKKDLIKIETDLELDYTVLGLIAPHVTVNFIKDGQRARKMRLELPEVVEGVLKCHNPRCITGVEHVHKHKFYLVDPETATYICEYCDAKTRYE